MHDLQLVKRVLPLNIRKESRKLLSPLNRKKLVNPNGNVCKTYYQNVNGLRTKLNGLLLNTSLSEYTILALTETNLDPTINDAELGFSNYNIYRCDRSSKSSDKMSGGGVLLAIHKDVHSFSIELPHDDLETVGVILKFGHSFFLFCAVYIPPSQPIKMYQSLCNDLEQLYFQVGLSYNFGLVGDFNINSANSPNSSAELINDMASTLGLNQHSDISNERGSQLDLYFSNLPCKVSRSLDPLVPEDMYHPALEIVQTLPSMTPAPPKPILTPNYYKCNIAHLRDDLNSNVSMFHPINTDSDSFNKFITDLSNLVKRHSPMKRVDISPFPRWFNNDLKSLTINKKRLHRIYKTTGFESDYTAFARARTACKTLAIKCYNSYITHIDSTLMYNPKVFWSHVKNLRRTDVTPSRLRLGDIETSDPDEMCNMFARHFSSVFTDAVQREFEFPERDNSVMLSLIQCTPDEVKRKLDALDPSKGVGTDCIPATILRQCSDLLCEPLSCFFNRSLREGHFPTLLKTSYTVPIFKDGNRDSASCYRPITIQSPITKIFESIVLDHIKPLIASVLIPEQHGFTAGRSTVTNLVQYEEYILSAFANFSQVDAIYLDFSKAFDKVSHSILIAKLKSYGIRDPLLSWIRSYLTGRSSIVKFLGVYSDPFSVTSGVPQGSLLGPYLFVLFINDIGEVIESTFLVFADDLKIYRVIVNHEDSNVLQRSLDAVSGWCEGNMMQLNASKCMVITFHRVETCLQTIYNIQGSRLKRVEVIKDLGIYLNKSLTPDLHVNEICGRARRLLGLLSRTAKSGLSIHAITVLYKTLVRPILEYASVAWRPIYLHQIIRLERIQRRFVRLVGTKLGMPFAEVPVDNLMNELDLCPLEVRRDLADLVFLFKLVNGALDCPDLLAAINFRTSRPTRSVELFAHMQHRTNYLKFGPLARLHRLGNSVPVEADFFSDSLKSFKYKLQSGVK